MSWKTIWKSLKNQDMRKRVLAVIGMLLVFRILAHIPLPLSDPKTLKQILDGLFTTDSSQLLSFLNIASGGALAHFSIMIVGLGPYINASIIMQLLTKALPKLEALQKEGEFGRKKINQYTRLLTLPLAIIQSVGAIYLVRQAAIQVGGIGDITAGVSLAQWVLMISCLTGGSMLLMWLGELITEQSVGNGISLVITVGIVSQLPSTISSFGKAMFGSGGANVAFLGRHFSFNKAQALYVGLITLGTLIVTMLIVKLNEAARQITVNYAKRVQGNRAYGGVSTMLPVKLITAGVIPIIFAVAFLSVPSFAGQILVNNSSAHLQQLGTHLSTWFASPSAQTFSVGGWTPFIYPAVYFLLVFLFTFFYTSIAFNSAEIAENLQKQGGFIEGVRSGKQTEKYLSKVVNRLTLFGAVALALLALLPIILEYVAYQFKFSISNLALSGTSVLILVSVSLETLRALESRALMVTYDQYEQPDFFYDEDVVPATASKKSGFSGKLLKRGKSTPKK